MGLILLLTWVVFTLFQEGGGVSKEIGGPVLMPVRRHVSGKSNWKTIESPPPSCSFWSYFNSESWVNFRQRINSFFNFHIVLLPRSVMPVH